MPILSWPDSGEWGLANPMSPLGHNQNGFYHKVNPPFAVLTIYFKTKTGTVRAGQTTAPIHNIKLIQSDVPKICASYAIGSQKGQFEARLLEKYELEIEFTGTAVTSVDAHPNRIVVEGVASTSGPEPAPEVEAPSSSPAAKINCAADIANSFDALVSSNDREVERWARDTISKHPGSWLAVGLAKTVYDVPKVLGQGTVDALRLGEGCYEGGWGYAKDGLRLLQFIPVFRALWGAGRSGTAVKTAVTAGETAVAEASEARAGGKPVVRLISPPLDGAPPVPRPVGRLGATGAKMPPRLDVRGNAVRINASTGVDPYPRLGTCAWSAVTRGIRMVKTQAYMSVHQLMKLACLDGVPIRPIAVADLIPTMNRLGISTRLARFTPLSTRAISIIDFSRRHAKSVIVFSVRWFKDVDGKIGSCNHALVAANGPNGIFIFDRCGAVVRSLSELESFYPGISSGFLKEAILLGDAGVKLVRQAGKAAPVVMIGFAATVAVEVQSEGGLQSNAAVR